MNRIALFGAGNWGREAYEELKEKYIIVCFLDNDKSKQGTKLFDLPIISLDKFIEQYIFDTGIVICTIQYTSVISQIKEEGITNYKVWYMGHLYDRRKESVNGITRCNRCVMDDESDDAILFDDAGYCNYCTTALSNIGKIYYPNQEGQRRLKATLDQIKLDGNGKKYDCIMGLSGGLDSSYLAYLGYIWGLRILAIHIDDGYDTDISKANLDKLISATGFDYEVVKPDKSQYNDLTLAFMKAGVPSLDIPQDNVLFAFLYKKMAENNIKYFLSGGNFALECILQKDEKVHSAYDLNHILEIHRLYGTQPIDKLEFISSEKLYEYKKKLGITTIRPLDFVDYNKERAFNELNKFCGFEYYGSKHLENVLTAFIQLYWYPKKFNVDKRKSHLSSMIVSGQSTREEALSHLNDPVFDETLMKKYLDIIKNNMNINDEMLNQLLKAPIHQHEEYVN